MPRGDRTGPIGKGPMTGRKLGKCVGNEEGGFVNDKSIEGHESSRLHRHHRAGNPHGRGHGYGWRHRYDD